MEDKVQRPECRLTGYLSTGNECKKEEGKCLSEFYINSSKFGDGKVTNRRRGFEADIYVALQSKGSKREWRVSLHRAPSKSCSNIFCIAYYPPPDNSVRKHLLQDAVGQIGVGKYGDLRSKYFLFFKHLFHLVRENVNKMKGRFGSIQTLAARWRELMLDANQELRSSTYEGAIRLAVRIYAIVKAQLFIIRNS